MIVERKGHIVELQSIRGLAALAVLVGHALNFYATPAWFTQAGHVFNGRAAVVLFFVLSGFVLTLALRKASLAPLNLIQFYVRRMARIYPAIWVASALGLAYLVFLHWRVPIPDTSAFMQERFRPDRMTPLHIAASFAGALAFIIPPLWSIFVEILASFAMPFIAVAAFRKRRVFIAAFLVLMTLSYAVGPRTYYAVGLYAPDFLIGAWIATLGPGLREQIARLKPVAPALMGLAALAMLFTQFLPLDYYDPTAHLVEAALAASLISLLVYSGASVRILQSRAALFLGDISYSVYLLHFLVLCLLGKAIGVFEARTGLDMALTPQAVLLAMLTLVATIPLAWLSFRFVENPGIDLGKWLAGKVAAFPFGRSPAPPLSPKPESEPAAGG